MRFFKQAVLKTFSVPVASLLMICDVMINLFPDLLDENVVISYLMSYVVLFDVISMHRWYSELN